MRTVEVKLYQYDELPSESAKEKAREWYTSDWDFFDSEYVIDDAATIAELFGLDIRQTRKTRMDGTHYYAPTVYWSGFWSQGDGACFEGSYKYAPGALARLKKEYPTETELHSLARRLQEIQKPFFYSLTASVSQSGRYSHSHTMRIDMDSTRESVSFDRDNWNSAESDLLDCFRDFADWIYDRLESQYEYETSEESVSESIRANDYEFTEDGEIA